MQLIMLRYLMILPILHIPNVAWVPLLRDQSIYLGGGEKERDEAERAVKEIKGREKGREERSGVVWGVKQSKG